MSRTPARVTQADVARAIRAAKQTGAGAVEVLPDGTIRIQLAPPAAPLAAPEPAASEPVAEEKVIVF
jgi:hypothetical protein